MNKVLLTLFTFITLCNLCSAQITHNPYYWDQPLSYNPGSVGALVDESVQMSLTTANGVDRKLRTFISPPNVIDLLFNRRNIEPSLVEIKNLYYLSYQKTKTFDNNNKFTIGLQFQKSKNAIAAFRDLSTIGLATNFHISRSKNRIKEKYWSFGLQTNLLFRKPNNNTIDIFYTALVESGYIIDLEISSDQFKSTNTRNTLSLNYTSHKFQKFLFNFGLNYIKLQTKSDYVFDGNLTDLNFTNVTSNTFLAAISKQFVLYEKLVLEFNVRTRFKILIPKQYRIYDLQDIFLGAGFGFKIRKENILRVAVILGGDTQTGGIYTIGLSLDHKQYSYNLSISQFTYPTTATILQLGISYKFNNETPTLLRAGN